MQEELERRKELGAMAYYQEWVKAWAKDTSKEAIEAHAEKTGEGVVDQLLDMFQHQTRGEYRIMQGTDIRIRRDPLTMRMREEQMKQGQHSLLYSLSNSSRLAESLHYLSLQGCRTTSFDLISEDWEVLEKLNKWRR